ncbi:alpha/beta hydrolase [Bacillus spongiae]|uniref:Alpha/beta hydrolase n=1 Tax=Bacillus spongiae TaxID=2683610 RepID=A0ABU8HF55_9BACI
MIEQTTVKAHINGIDVYYEYHPQSLSDETFVLLHGFLSSTFSFRRLTPLLKKHYNVLVIDLPPFGKSGKSVRFRYSYENLGKTVLHLLEKLQLTNVYVAGHSMGGQIALNMMKLRPEIVEKGILLCSSGYLNRARRSLSMLSYAPFFHLYVKYWLKRTGIRRNLENVLHDSEMIDDDMISGYLTPFLDKKIFRALTRMIRDREGDLPEHVLHNIHTPCLLIWGDHDRVVPLNVGIRLNKDLPNATIVVLEKTGHLVPEEKPDEVLHHIQQFVVT